MLEKDILKLISEICPNDDMFEEIMKKNFTRENRMRPGDKIISFGPYCFKTLDQIADSDEGLLYLDKIIDEISSPDFKENLKAFLTQPHIQIRLKDLI